MDWNSGSDNRATIKVEQTIPLRPGHRSQQSLRSHYKVAGYAGIWGKKEKMPKLSGVIDNQWYRLKSHYRHYLDC